MVQAGVSVAGATVRYRHTLIVGGTGMLRAASIALASHSRRLTAVARTERSLKALNLEPSPGGTHHLLALDWCEPDGFLNAVRTHLARTDPPDLVVAWIHDDNLAIRFAESLDESAPGCRFFHVVGSAAADPARIAASLSERTGLLNIAYRQILLGYVDDGEQKRWLTNGEISAGVLNAIKLEQRKPIVGTVQPWAPPP